MKKVFYIGLVGIGLFATSCTKQTITPVSTTTDEAPTWRSTSGDGGKATTDDSADDTDGNTLVSDGAITDPNNDKDETIRKKH